MNRFVDIYYGNSYLTFSAMILINICDELSTRFDFIKTWQLLLMIWHCHHHNSSQLQYYLQIFIKNRVYNIFCKTEAFLTLVTCGSNLIVISCNLPRFHEVNRSVPTPLWRQPKYFQISPCSAVQPRYNRSVTSIPDNLYCHVYSEKCS